MGEIPTIWGQIKEPRLEETRFANKKKTNRGNVMMRLEKCTSTFERFMNGGHSLGQVGVDVEPHVRTGEDDRIVADAGLHGVLHQ